MESKVAPYAATPDPTFGKRSAPRKAKKADGRKSAQADEGQADLRLMIEEDQATGSYLYKTINRRTGEVVLQLPREEIVKLGEETEYVAGSVIRAKA